MEVIQSLQSWIDQSNYIVFFGGAGVSTESGIPDFRSVDGLYNQKYDELPETILSHTYYVNHTESFYHFYKEKMLLLKAEPNAAHNKLAELEKAGKLKAVITQNIDGLHQAAGSKKVLELHGSIHRNYCQHCGREYPALFVKEADGIPKCIECQSTIKPDVVLYEEGLKQKTMAEAIHYISQADMLIIGGTSLAVYPAAGLIRYYRGKRLVLVNKSVTVLDKEADLLIRENIGALLSKISV